MTVIAWDGNALAADKRVTDGRGKTTTTTKISCAPGGLLLGGTGDASVVAELRAWFLAGAAPADFPNSARGNVADFYVFSAEGVQSYCAGPYPTIVECERFAVGSGGDLAQGVLHMGGSALEAVQAACLYRGDCGGGVDVLNLF